LSDTQDNSPVNGPEAPPQDEAQVGGADTPTLPIDRRWGDPSSWAPYRPPAGGPGTEADLVATGQLPAAEPPTSEMPPVGAPSEPAAWASWAALDTARTAPTQPPPVPPPGDPYRSWIPPQVAYGEIPASGPSLTAAPAATGDAATGAGRKRRPLAVAALVMAAALLFFGAGVAVGVALDHNGSSSAGLTSNNNGFSSGSGSLSVSQIAKLVEPGVVDITSTLGTQGGEDEGTGMIITSSGDVLTNNHVVANATSITAQIDGTGHVYDLKVLGVDPTADVALLQLEGGSSFATVTLGNSSTVQVGNSVVAIGNALALQGAPTVTSGTISAINRSITASDDATNSSENLSGLLQTDASINPGNSGGPLINTSGVVIGMNTAAATGSETQTATNIGFAIPINTALSIVHQIELGQSNSKIDLGQHGLLGVGVLSVSQAESQQGLSDPFQTYTPPAASGAVVVEVDPGTPAAAAGIQVGDVIVGFDGRKISSPTDLSNVIHHLQPGTSASVTWVDLNHQQHTTTVVLAIAAVL
jgi:S1-C subfamily serine protease